MAARAYKCSIDGCHSKAWARGWCNKHYLRWQNHGDPNTVLVKVSRKGEGLDFIRFAIGFRKDMCLPWPFAKKEDGRGVVWFEGRLRIASNLVCEMVNGPAPEGKTHAAHSCGRGHVGCINPLHLSWKTPTENQADRLTHGTDNRGIKHGMSKLTPAKVRQIRALRGSITIRKIADKFGVTHTCIDDIYAGRTWAHLP